MKSSRIEFGCTSPDRYVKGEVIGEGAYGKVYKAKDNDTGAEVALKEYKLELITQGVPQTSMKEISLLRKLNHPNIVRYSFCFVIPPQQTSKRCDTGKQVPAGL